MLSAQQLAAVRPVIKASCNSHCKHVSQRFESQPACSAEAHLINLQSRQGPLSSTQTAEISILPH